MNRNIAAVRPLTLCASRNERLTTCSAHARTRVEPSARPSTGSSGHPVLGKKPDPADAKTFSVLDQAELFRDQRRLATHLTAPAGDIALLEAHLRHRDADRRQWRGAVVGLHGNRT